MPRFSLLMDRSILNTMLLSFLQDCKGKMPVSKDANTTGERSAAAGKLLSPPPLAAFFFPPPLSRQAPAPAPPPV